MIFHLTGESDDFNDEIGDVVRQEHSRQTSEQFVGQEGAKDLRQWMAERYLGYSRGSNSTWQGIQDS